MVKQIAPDLRTTAWSRTPGSASRCRRSTRRWPTRSTLAAARAPWSPASSRQPGRERRPAGRHRPDVIDGETYAIGGDIIMSVDGKPVESITELQTAIQEHRAGDVVKLDRGPRRRPEPTCPSRSARSRSRPPRLAPRLPRPNVLTRAPLLPRAGPDLRPRRCVLSAAASRPATSRAMAGAVGFSASQSIRDSHEPSVLSTWATTRPARSVRAVGACGPSARRGRRAAAA